MVRERITHLSMDYIYIVSRDPPNKPITQLAYQFLFHLAI